MLERKFSVDTHEAGRQKIELSDMLGFEINSLEEIYILNSKPSKQSYL